MISGIHRLPGPAGARPRAPPSKTNTAQGARAPTSLITPRLFHLKGGSENLHSRINLGHTLPHPAAPAPGKAIFYTLTYTKDRHIIPPTAYLRHMFNRLDYC